MEIVELIVWLLIFAAVVWLDAYAHDIPNEVIEDVRTIRLPKGSDVFCPDFPVDEVPEGTTSLNDAYFMAQAKEAAYLLKTERPGDWMMQGLVILSAVAQVVAKVCHVATDYELGGSRFWHIVIACAVCGVLFAIVRAVYSASGWTHPKYVTKADTPMKKCSFLIRNVEKTMERNNVAFMLNFAAALLYILFFLNGELAYLGG